ncbi:MAG: dihydroneopterin aldolase, partial [Muribaculaceae bacterium]|nr:dihydroneopterin aldolase [Muribaculaceae bacterium]
MSPHSIEKYTVGLRDMRIFAYHGVMPQENRVGNEYRVNCSVSYITSGENNDNIDNTISYADLH